MRNAFYTLISIACLAFANASIAEDAADNGKTVFEASCASCHTGWIGGWMSGAPDIDDKEDWQPLLVKGVEALTEGTIIGVGEMAPRGKCDTCSDADIRAAVEYIIDQTR